jgi:hypothetical protein
VSESIEAVIVAGPGRPGVTIGRDEIDAATAGSTQLYLG